MGHVANRRSGDTQSVPFAEIPGLPPASVHGHKGCLTLGDWAGRRVLLFEGRLHYYEGHPWEVVVRPLQTAAALGACVALLTNAAGGIADALGPGREPDGRIRDHVEWTRPFFWRHPGPDARPSPYSARLLQTLARAAKSLNCQLHEGVYTAVTRSRSYETPAEIRARWRAGAATRSACPTAREVQAGPTTPALECAAISLITNKAAGLAGATLNHEEVLAIAAAQSARLADLLERFLVAVDSGP